MYDKTVTVFHKYTDKDDVIYWHPYVLHNVDLIVDKAANVAKTGLDSADTAKLHVRYRQESDQKLIGDKCYLEPKAWKMFKDKTGILTFSSGDIFMEGEFSGSVISDEEYTSRVYKGFYDYLNRTNDNVYLITSVGGPYTLIPHFEIGGK